MVQEYAFGHNEVDGCKCPAVVAGYEPDKEGYTLDVAEAFDRVVRGDNDDCAGTIPEPEARDAWKELVDRYRETVEEYEHDFEDSIPNGTHKTYVERMNRAKEIGDELGWL